MSGDTVGGLLDLAGSNIRTETLAEIDRQAREFIGKPFADCTPAELDELLDHAKARLARLEALQARSHSIADLLLGARQQSL